MRYSLILLVSSVGLVIADFGGVCLPAQRCGYDCCREGQTCQDNHFCVDGAYVSSALASALPSKAASSALLKISESGGVSSLLQEYSSILTDAPLPTGLDGSTILDGNTMNKTHTRTKEPNETGESKTETGTKKSGDASETGEKSTSAKSTAKPSATTTNNASSSPSESSSASTSASVPASASTGAASKMGMGVAGVVAGVAGVAIVAL